MFRLNKAKRNQRFARTKKEENIIIGGFFDEPKEDKSTNSVFLPDDVVNDTRRMNPQQPVQFLLNNR